MCTPGKFRFSLSSIRTSTTFDFLFPARLDFSPPPPTPTSLSHLSGTHETFRQRFADLLLFFCSSQLRDYRRGTLRGTAVALAERQVEVVKLLLVSPARFSTSYQLQRRSGETKLRTLWNDQTLPPLSLYFFNDLFPLTKTRPHDLSSLSAPCSWLSALSLACEFATLEF